MGLSMNPAVLGLKRTILLVAIGAVFGAAGASLAHGSADWQPPWIWGRLRAGAFGVGIQVVSGTDNSRRETSGPSTGQPRPLDLVIWYPTVRRLTRKPIRFERYVDLSDAAPSAGLRGRPDAWRRRWLAEAMSRDPASVPTTLVNRVLSSPMAAVLDAPPAAARQPLILWSTRHATPAAQSVLSEYLASHGYVVAWVQYAGADSLPPPYDNVAAQRKTEILEAHVADLQWALRELARFPSVDSRRMGVAAWSYSGEPATVLAQRTPELRLLLSLSSNVFVPTYRSIDMGASLDSEPLRTDVVMLEQTGEAQGRPNEAPPWLDRLPGKVYRITFSTLAHGNFNVLEGLLPGLTGLRTVQPWAVRGAVAQTGYENVCRSVLSLLDKTLKGATTLGPALPTVTTTWHGPGRTELSTSGTAYTDTRVAIRSDSWELIGNMVQPPTPSRVPAVLMLNKADGDRRVYTAVARELARRGIASLRLDVRGHGESTSAGSFVPGMPNDAMALPEHDVEAALRWLRAGSRVDSGRIGVVGASYTGEAMAIAGRHGARARAYVALSPGSLSEETIDGIDPSGAAWWVLASRDERFLRDVMDALRSRSRNARVTEVDGRAHASDMLVSNPALAAQIADWLASTLTR